MKSQIIDIFTSVVDGEIHPTDGGETIFEPIKLYQSTTDVVFTSTAAIIDIFTSVVDGEIHPTDGGETIFEPIKLSKITVVVIHHDCSKTFGNYPGFFGCTGFCDLFI